MASKSEKANVWMQIIISLLLLLVGVAILTAPHFIFPQAFSDGTQKMAAGWIGAVIGYWLA